MIRIEPPTDIRRAFPLRTAAALALFAVAVPNPIVAQNGTLAGRVVDAGSAQPLAGAQLQVVGTSLGVVSDEQGAFSFSAPAGTHSVSVVLIGYQTVRLDGIEVRSGERTTIDVELSSRALSLNPVNVTVNRGREERTLATPAQVSVVKARTIEETAAITPVQYVKGLPGVDVVQTGIQQSSVVTRGFNGVFNGSLLVLTDHRYGRVPSLRLNEYSLLATSPLDVERVEMVLGPAAALYGPNAAQGVMHVITSSPIDDSGTRVSLEGGTRSIFQGAFRHAVRFSDKAGLKVSGRYLSGTEFHYTDPVEIAAQATSDNPLVGARDFDLSNYGGEIRLDLRPWDDPNDEVVFTAGYSNISNIVATGLGHAQAKSWSYRFGHLRLSRKGLFAQAFYNMSGAGDTYLLRTGETLVDDSNVLAGQLQYGFDLGERVEVIAGADYAYTRPVTGGTIHGRFENEDNITEYGGYLHGRLALADALDLVAVARLDRHQYIDQDIVTPRAAFVYEPADGQSFRLSYGSGFETPTSTDFFLDLISGNLPISSSIGFPLRARGVRGEGFTWNNRCPGGVNDYCMYSPFAPGQSMPATGAVLWDSVLLPLALTDPGLQAVIAQLGLTPQVFAQIVGSPQAGDIGSLLLRLNPENPADPFIPDPGVADVVPLDPVVTRTYEVGYSGIIGDRALLSVSAYRSNFDRTYGSLQVVTPTVFLEGGSVAQFLVHRLTNAGIPAEVATPIAVQIAGLAASVPLGTVAPDQAQDHDILVSYPTYGQDIEGGVSWYGLDFGLEVMLSDQVTFTGSYSHVSKDCFDMDLDGACPGFADVPLNAPKNKLALGARWENRLSGWHAGTRMRYSDGFPMNSGVYVGNVEAYSVLDLALGYRFSGSGLMLGLNVTNVLDNVHREFVGAPEIGRLALLKAIYEF